MGADRNRALLICALSSVLGKPPVIVTDFSGLRSSIGGVMTVPPPIGLSSLRVVDSAVLPFLGRGVTVREGKLCCLTVLIARSMKIAWSRSGRRHGMDSERRLANAERMDFSKDKKVRRAGRGTNRFEGPVSSPWLAIVRPRCDSINGPAKVNVHAVAPRAQKCEIPGAQQLLVTDTSKAVGGSHVLSEQ